MKNVFDFEVEKRPIFFKSGEDSNGNDMNILIKNKEVIVNTKTNESLSVMSGSYNLFNNQSFSELSLKIQENLGLVVKDHKSYKGGRKVFTSFSNPDNKKMDLMGHTFSNNLILVDSRDGSTCLGLAGVGTLHRCDNMFTTFKQSKNKFKIYHNSNLDTMIREFELSLNMYSTQQRLYLERLERLGDIKVDQNNIYDFIGDWISMDRDQVKKVAYGKLDVSTQKKNIVDNMIGSWSVESDDLGKNGFAAWNAVTHMFTHKKNKTEESLLFENFGRKESEMIKFAECLS